MKEIAIYGAGGFGKEICCVIKAINEIKPTWRFIGFFDDGMEIGKINRYGNVLGGIDSLNNWETEISIVISIATPNIIETLVSKIKNPLVNFPNIIAPSVHFLDVDSYDIGEGNVIFFGSRISCDVTIGNFNLMNGFISLGHDAIIGDFNVLGPSSRISGNSRVGNTNFFGVCSIILQDLKIGNNTRIGANSVIMKNTHDGNLYFGNPAKRISLQS